MPVTLLLAGLRIPADVAAAVVPSLQTPALRGAIARASRGALTHDNAAHHAWLARHVFERAPGGPAPYAYAALARRKPRGTNAVWQADPVHLELARDHLVAMPVTSPPSDEEAGALFAAANAIVAAVGARFEHAGGNWFLFAPPDLQLETVPLEKAWQSSVHDVLPGGNDAQRWSRLLNDIQMAWHAHPVNAAREACGEATINSVWLNGGGIWAALPALPYSAVASDVPAVRGAADAAAVPVLDAEAPWPDGALVVWSDALTARALHDWPAWQAAVQSIDARLQYRIRSVATDFVLTGLRSALTLHWRPAHRLQFWRNRPLEEVLSE